MNGTIDQTKMWIPAFILIVGLFTVIFASEKYNIRLGGVVVVPLLGMYVLFDFRALPLFVISSVVAYVSLEIIDRRFVLYGRTLLLTAILLGALVPVTTFLVAVFLFGETFPLRNIAFVGSILPGLAAYNFRRLGRDERVTDLFGSLTLVVALVLLAAVFLLARSLVLEPDFLQALFATAGEFVTGERSLGLTDPTPILPRAIVVGLFILGLLLNEWFQHRYGLRLAGLIALPLVAVFTLYDPRLLILFVCIVLVSGAFIRVIHRLTLLYGRNLLAGACITGVMVAAIATPLLPASPGLRPLIIGLLGAVTAYNSHVLAPPERVHSAILNIGTFTVLFAVANTAALLFNRPYTYGVGADGIVLGVAILLTTGLFLLDFELLRPEQPIERLANEGTVVPDGGTDPQRELMVDGGRVAPLAGRRVARFGPNARVVQRHRDQNR